MAVNFPLLFLLASATCLVAGTLAWTLLKLAERAWPGIAAQRAVWLLAQLAVAVTFALALVPRSAELSVVPAIELSPAARQTLLATGAPGPMDGYGRDALSGATGGSGATGVTGTVGMAGATGVTRAIGMAGATGMAEATSVTGVTGAVGVTGAIGPAGATGAAGDAGPAAARGMTVPRWLSLLSLAWLPCYCTGLLHAVWRWVRAQRALCAVLRTADRVSGAALKAHQGFVEVSPYSGPPVLETPVPVSPMLVGLLEPRLLLPSHLAQFDAQQQQLIVAHELTHWRRRDHVWLHASLLLQTLFWFNPAVRSMRAKMNWAQELACDQQVLAGRPAQQRQSYAAALVAQLKLQQAMVSGGYPASAFGGAGVAALSNRIKLIRAGGAGVLGAVGKALLGCATVALLAASVLLQPAFAWRVGDAEGATDAAGVTGAAGVIGAVDAKGVSGVSGAAGVADAKGVPGAAGAKGVADVAAAGAPAPSLANGGLRGAASGAGRDKANAALPSWRAPLEAARVSSFYGARSKPLPSSRAFHRGIDFAAHRGTPVMAPAAGTVVESTALYDGQPKFGQVIVIDHGDGLRSMYAHLDRRSVRMGDRVAAGEAIGLSGATGRVTGPHLHLEVLRNGEHVDPALLIANLDLNAFPSALRARTAAPAN